MNTCKTCRHPSLKEINGLLVNRIPLRTVANQFGLKHPGLVRHKEKCIPELLQTITEEQRESRREGLLQDVDELKAEINEVKSDFNDNGNVRVQLLARRKDAIDLEAKLTGAYMKEKENPQTAAEYAKDVADRLVGFGWDRSSAEYFGALNAEEVEIGGLETVLK